MPIQSSLLIGIGVLGALTASVWSQSAAAQSAANIGSVVGHIDGISRDGEQYFIAGWACQLGQKQSIAVRIFADSSRSAFLTAGMANLSSEPAIAQACQDRAGGKHRFFIVLPIAYRRVAALDVEDLSLAAPRKQRSGSGRPLAQHARWSAFPPRLRLTRRHLPPVLPNTHACSRRQPT